MEKNQEENEKESCNCESHCGCGCGCGKVLLAIFIFGVGLLIGIALGGRYPSKCGMMGKWGCHEMAPSAPTQMEAPKK
jgi:hypothetical protein